MFVNTTSRLFTESYSQEKEISLSILEELEEVGYSVVWSEGIWEESNSRIFNDHLESFQNTLKGKSIENRPRIQIWKERAEAIGATQVFLLRYCFSSEPNTIPIRMLWINLSNNTIKRFDWIWNAKTPFPFRDFFQQTSGEKF
ncbi:hypothetical protein JWG40_12785 [Leptospira sp. 201903074]|nr:hypothetical protein [Leptospira abararensis]